MSIIIKKVVKFIFIDKNLKIFLEKQNNVCYNNSALHMRLDFLWVAHRALQKGRRSQRIKLKEEKTWVQYQ